MAPLIERLKTVTEDIEVTLDGRTVTETVDAGHITKATAERHGGLFIRLHLEAGSYIWNAPLRDYDPDTVSSDPVVESRWVIE